MTERHHSPVSHTPLHRYTIVLPEDKYTSGVLSVLRSMQADPSVESASIKNYWKSPKSDGYDAIHVLVKDATTGFDWELQLHTPATYSAKNESHTIYEKLRTMTKGSQEYETLSAESAAIWGAVKDPAGVVEEVDKAVGKLGKVHEVAAVSSSTGQKGVGKQGAGGEGGGSASGEEGQASEGDATDDSDER